MTIITTASEQDVKFIGTKEGFVGRTYVCPAGVLTIGYGFTMRSAVFAAYWKKTRGHALRMGDTITRAEANKLLRALIDEEYGKPVGNAVLPQKQQHFGGATSMSFNCGKGSLKWKWAQALRRGDVKDCVTRLVVTGITANGRVLEGLKSRRRAEARLIEHGDYGTFDQTAHAAESTSVKAIKEYQAQLQTLGYYKGTIDGLPGRLTDGAVRNFQRDQGLKVDGIVGPATRATLIRALDAKHRNNVAIVVPSGGVVTAPITAPSFLDSPLSIVLVVVGIVAVVFIGHYVWSRRGRITGQRVPT